MITKILFNKSFLILTIFIYSLYVNTSDAENKLLSDTEPTNKADFCQDFLASLNKKPKNLEFIECKKIVLHGDEALESRYRVKGTDASTVEAYFVNTAHMPELRYICCGWESLPKNPKTQKLNGVYVSDQKNYLIGMDSGETLVNQRSDWGSIPYFNVTVVLYLDAP